MTITCRKSIWFRGNIFISPQREHFKTSRRILGQADKRNDWDCKESISRYRYFRIACMYLLNVRQYWGKMWEYICICADSVKALKSAESFDEVGSAYDTYIAKTKLGTAVRTYKNAEAPIEQWQYYANRYNAMREDLLNTMSYLPNGNAEHFNKYIHSEEMKQTIDDIVWITVLVLGIIYEQCKSKKERQNILRH